MNWWEIARWGWMLLATAAIVYGFRDLIIRSR